MKYLIAKYILFSIVMALFSLSLYGGYKFSKNIWYFLAYEHLNAQIISCEPERFERRGNTGVLSKGIKVNYTPVAKTSDGFRIKGVLYYDRARCYKGIGSSVSVLISPDSKESYMLTFSQFWLMPLILIVVPTIAILIFFVPILKAVKPGNRPQCQ